MPAMGVELDPTPKAPKNQSLAIRLIAKFHPLDMLLFGRSARTPKTLAEHPLKIHDKTSLHSLVWSILKISAT